jgi:hypothetical protein
VGGLVNNEFEIFGQRYHPVLFADGFESASLDAWSP